MHLGKHVWNVFQQHSTISLMVKVNIVVALALLSLGVCVSMNTTVQAQSGVCSNQVSMRTTDCIPSRGTVNAGSVHVNDTALNNTSSKTGYIEVMPNIAFGNQFPWPQCTWWANERYHQMHGIYVPWRTQSDAWQWTARAHDFHWHVSNTPAVGWIMDLQPWVQGAYGLGHVGVVEKLLNNGYFVASNMNWGSNPTQVTYVTFHAASGVTFIHQ